MRDRGGSTGKRGSRRGSVGIPHGSWAVLVGGPESGAVVRIELGQDVVVVVEQKQFAASDWIDVEHVDVLGTSPRHGQYRRVGTSDNFEWMGWDA